MTRTLNTGARLALAALFAVTVSVVSASPFDTPDAWITMKAKISLMTADGVSTSDLNVDTVTGVVTLHGKVASAAEKTQAEKVVSGITGVKDVKNLLQVVPSVDRASVNRADGETKNDVEAAFKANKRIAESGVKVASVNKGVVLLAGETKSLQAHLEAVQVAYAVRGVRRVATEVEVKE